MSEAMVTLGVAETVQGGQSTKEGYMFEMSREGDYLHLGLGEYQHTSGKETNSKISNACICVSLREGFKNKKVF